ncbi:hypothetical protein [Gorillibacterium sp. sgz5001074]|uniref:hypothetical protein n=1 Tax=Gorillibacterium sp. sgz5001074 TaxID=3446695 RepID=UPI003F672308
MPHLLLEGALIVVIVRSAYKAFQLASSSHKSWLDIAFHASVGILALSFFW